MLILKSIEELRAKKKRSDHESFVSHAVRQHGLSVKDGRESLSCLLNKGSVSNKPPRSGPISLFVKDKPCATAETPNVVGDQHNDSFLCFLDNVKTPTKEISHQPQFISGENVSPD